MKKLLFTSIAMGLIFFSCSKSNTGGGNNNGGGTLDCSNVPKTFADVNPVFQSTCAANSGCHGAGSVNGPGPLLNYTQIFNDRVAIRGAVASGTMPQGSSLPSSQKNSILCWIDNGAPNN